MSFNICQALLLAVAVFSTVTLSKPVAAEHSTDQASAAFQAASAEAETFFDAAHEALENNAADKDELIMQAQAAAIRLYSGDSGAANTVDYLTKQMEKTVEAMKEYQAAHPLPQQQNRRIAKRRSAERDVAMAGAVDRRQSNNNGCNGILGILGNDVCDAITDKVTDAISNYDPSSSSTDSTDSTDSTTSTTPVGFPFYYPYPYTGTSYPFSGYPYGGYFPYGFPKDPPGKTSCDDQPDGFICGGDFDELKFCRSKTWYYPQSESSIQKCGRYFCCIADSDGSSGCCLC